MVSKILVALDHSDSSDGVFDVALALAKSCQAHLLLLHILSPMEEGYPPIPLMPGLDSYYPLLQDDAVKQYLKNIADFEQQSLAKLRHYQAKATDAGVRAEFSQNLGSAGPMICRVAQTWEADLIVVGRRGNSGLKELLLGSVSNYVIHHANCSVLTVQGIPPGSAAADQSERSTLVG